MGQRTTLKNPDAKPDVDLQFMNWFSQFCAMVMPRDLSIVAGRGSAKTTEIQVERLIEMVYDMPGAPVAWAADTFANLNANVLPMVFEALERKGFTEGRHYVVEKQLPTFTEKECEDLPDWLKSHFWRPTNKIISHKRMIVFFTGLNITFGSLDRPASLAGRSYVHVFGDEAKYFSESKIANLLKAVRGYRVQFGHSPFYRGRTFTTDMPNPSNPGEDDWIFKDAQLMDKEMILLVFKSALVANEAMQEYIAAKDKFQRTLLDRDRTDYKNKLKIANRWRERWYELRKQKRAQKAFFLVSSYVNVDILSLEWFEDALASQLSDVNAAILSMPPKVETQSQFYPNLGDRHFYYDGNIASIEVELGFTDAVNCTLLKYLDMDKYLEMSMDFGNMLSLIVAQDDGRYLRALKTFHCLPPEWIRQLADKFLTYFKPHRQKYIKFYYDRSGNNYHRSGDSFAQKIKAAIERDANDQPTGWTVELMSLGQGDITMEDEYIVCRDVMIEHNPTLPRLRIDALNCRTLKLSLENAKTIIDSKKRVGKDKRSEKSTDPKKLLESTNFTDAFKYLIMREEWIEIVKIGYSSIDLGSVADVSVVSR